MAIDGGHGDSHAGKSQALESLARYWINSTGKKVRVWIGDGGGETYNSHGLVDDGMIELMDFSIRDYPLTVLKFISEGYFLKDPKDQNSKLVPPPVNESELYAMRVYEGGTVMGNWMMSDIPGGMEWHGANHTGWGGIKDENAALSYEDSFKDVEGMSKEQLEGMNLQGDVTGLHAYKVQRKLVSAIRRSKQFPGLTWWTFHSIEAPDKSKGGTSKGHGGEIVGAKIIGPDAGGKAPASNLTKEFGNFYHFDKAIKVTQELERISSKQIQHVVDEYRLYTRRHYDPNADVKVEYIAGTRIPVKEYYVSKEPGDSLLQAYQAAKEQRALNSKKETK